MQLLEETSLVFYPLFSFCFSQTILCLESHAPALKVIELHQEFKTPLAHRVQEQDADRRGNPRCLVSSEKTTTKKG